VQRVSVVGTSGSGKTSLARALGARLGVEHVELDALFHQPGWEPLPTPRFREVVAERCAADAWVVEGNYSAVRDLVWARADTVVVLDLPRRTVMRQVITRTVRRTVTREELWNGNREPWSNLWALHDRERSVVRWACDAYPKNRARYRAAAADPAHRDLRFVFLRSRREMDAFAADATSG